MLFNKRRKQYGKTSESQKIKVSAAPLECSICALEFTNKDFVIQLMCSKGHVFHEDCISDWIKVQLNCPLCRKDIEEKEIRSVSSDISNRKLQMYSESDSPEHYTG